MKEKNTEVQELDIFLATQKVNLATAKEKVNKLEKKVADLKAKPKGRHVESELAFEQEAYYWERR